MAENPAAVASAPASASLKLDAKEQLFRELIEALKGGQVVQEQLLKEHTQALQAQTRAMNDLRRAILGEEPSAQNPDGVDGLMDILADVDESLEELDGRMTGMNLILARYSWVFDRLVEINTGNPEVPELEAGKEPTPGLPGRAPRSPNFRDVVAALAEFDKEQEKEALAEAAAEEERKKKEEEAARAAETPAKTSMLSNAPAAAPKPALRALPPLPRMAPRPAE